jgi:hypothetical protein
MDENLQRRALAIICEEVPYSRAALSSDRLYERLVSEGREFSYLELQNLLKDWIETGIVSGTVYISRVEITDVDGELCDEV